MSSFTGTVSLIDLGDTRLAIKQSETLMIGQSSEIQPSSNADDMSVGSFEYAGAEIPCYVLDEQMRPEQASDIDVDKTRFCVGLKTSDEANNFVVLCEQFEQVEITEKTHNIQKIPNFMFPQDKPVDRMFEHNGKVYLTSSPDQLFSFISLEEEG